VRSRSHRHARHVARIAAGGSGHFTIAPGHRAEVSVRLSRSSRRLLAARRRMRLTAVVHADPFAGGSGYGRHLTLSLSRG
jgi:hypothetical protein